MTFLFTFSSLVILVETQAILNTAGKSECTENSQTKLSARTMGCRGTYEGRAESIERPLLPSDHQLWLAKGTERKIKTVILRLYYGWLVEKPRSSRYLRLLSVYWSIDGLHALFHGFMSECTERVESCRNLFQSLRGRKNGLWHVHLPQTLLNFIFLAQTWKSQNYL